MDVIHLLRRTAAAVLVKALILTFFAVSLYNVMSFSASTSRAVNKNFSTDAKVNVYGITDELFDADEFHEFRQSPARVKSVAKFYDELDANGHVQLLSMTDQPIPVIEPRGDRAFEYGYGTEMGTRGTYVDELTGQHFKDLKSVQMNRAVFDFYKLAVSTGSGLDWQRVDWSDATVPVLLGANYSDLYDVGDKLRGNLYFEEKTFRVAGFLEPDSSVFYQEEMNHYLDDYVLIPYPPSIADFSPPELDFYGIVAFQMISANLAADVSMTTDDVLLEIRRAAEVSGFDQYQMTNVPSYLTQFSLIRQLMADNLGLLILIQAALALGSLAGVVALNQFIQNRRSPRTRIRWTLGHSRQQLARTAFAATTAEYALVLVMVVLAIRILPQESPVSVAVVGFLFAAVLAVDAVVQQKMLGRVLAATARESV